MNLLPKETVGQRIRIAREYLAAERQQKVSQADLAELCGWGQTRIANYERDLRRADADAIQAIARITGCRAEWIQFGTGAMHAYQEGMIASGKVERDRQRLAEGKGSMTGEGPITEDGLALKNLSFQAQSAVRKTAEMAQQGRLDENKAKLLNDFLEFLDQKGD